MDGEARETRPEKPPYGPDLTVEDARGHTTSLCIFLGSLIGLGIIFSDLKSEDKVEEERLHGDIHVQERTVQGALSLLQFCLQIIEDQPLCGLLFPCGPPAGLHASPCLQEVRGVQCSMPRAQGADS